MAVSYTPPGQSKRVTAVFAPAAVPAKGSDKIEPLAPDAVKSPGSMPQTTVKPDPEMSYDSGTKVKLPG